ncbi:MAG: hypothetical protein WBC91_16580 [Phototrophicaceae bacterium]
MRDKKMQNRITLFLGIFLSFGMVAGLVSPLLLSQQNLNPAQTRPTNTPRPTQPAPPDVSTINFDQTYLHPSGLFTAAIPTNYLLSNEFNSSSEAQVTMENSAALSVLEIRVIRPTLEASLDSPQNLGEIFNTEWLRSSWSRYSSWSEDARRVEGEQLVIDFSLTRGGQDYAARQVAFTDGTWIYMIRVVAPSNASEVIQYVLENEVASFQPVERFVGSPLEWNGYFDDTSDHLVRFPGDWQVVDAVDGAPASIAGPNAQLRIETIDASIDTAEAAEAYVAGLRSNITVLSSEAVELDGNAGFRVAYTQSTVDGATQSGVVQFITVGDTTHVINVLLTDVADTDFNTVDVEAEGANLAIVDALSVLNTFSLFPALELGS